MEGSYWYISHNIHSRDWNMYQDEWAYIHRQTYRVPCMDPINVWYEFTYIKHQKSWEWNQIYCIEPFMFPCHGHMFPKMPRCTTVAVLAAVHSNRLGNHVTHNAGQNIVGFATQRNCCYNHPWTSFIHGPLPRFRNSCCVGNSDWIGMDGGCFRCLTKMALAINSLQWIMRNRWDSSRGGVARWFPPVSQLGPWVVLTSIGWNNTS